MTSIADAPEITWHVLTESGINTDAVDRELCPTGGTCWTYTRGDFRAAFSECPDIEGEVADGEHPGWSLMFYERLTRPHETLGDETIGWDDVCAGPEYFEAADLDAMLARVVEYLDNPRPTSVDGIIDVLTHYDGDNVFEDVIYGLDYDEAATDAVASPDREDAVISGHHFRRTQRGWEHVGTSRFA